MTDGRRVRVGARRWATAAQALVLAATLLVLVQLPGAPPAAAADLDWDTPQPVAPGLTGIVTQDVVVDARGATTVVFDVGSNPSAVYAVHRPRGGEWEAPVRLGPGHYPRVDAAADGTVTAVWTGGNGDVVMYAATRPAGQPWTPAAEIATGDDVRGPVDDLEVAPGGAVAVVWDHDRGFNTVVSGISRAGGGAWGSATILSPLAATGQKAHVDPSVGFDAAGRPTAVWAELPSEYQSRLWTASATGPTWGAGSPFGPALPGYVSTFMATNDLGASVLLLDARGVGRSDGPDRLSASYRSAGGAWSAPATLRDAGTGATVESVAAGIGRDGVASVAWVHNAFAAGNRVQVVTGTGGSWSAPRTFESNGSETLTSVQVAADPDGVQHVVWERQAYGSAGGGSTLATATRSPAGVWAGPFVLTSPSSGTSPRLSIGADGTGAVVFRAPLGLSVTIAERPGLVVDLQVYDEQGSSLDGRLAPGQYVRAELTVTNDSGERLDDVEFAGTGPLVVDPRSPGGVQVTGVPAQPAPTTLEDGESVVLAYDLTTTARGVAAAHTKVTATGAETGELFEEGRSLRFDIETGQVVDEALGRVVMLQVIDRYLMKMYDDFMDALATRAGVLKEQLRAVLSPAQFRAWFGRGSISPLERTQAQLQGVDPSYAANRLPDSGLRGYTVEELNGAYNDAFLDKLGEGVGDWVQGWRQKGAAAKAIARDAWGEALQGSYWMVGNATPQERMEFEAKMVQFAVNNDTTATNLIDTIKREIPRMRENGTYVAEAVDTFVKDATLRSPDLKAQLAQDQRARDNLIRLAATDPVAFQRKWAERDAAIANQVLPLILDTILGSAAGRLGAVEVTGKGAAVASSGKAIGVLDAQGAKAVGTRTSVPLSGTGDLTGAGARTTEDFLEHVDGATIVKSTDQGNVYSLPNVGGVPEITLDAKAGILGDLEREYAAATGKQLKLAEVLKPSSPVRKPGGVAKLELTAQKTGKEAMLDAGAPDAIYGEASVWRSSTNPAEIKGFDTWDNARQKSAIKEWETANQNWAEFENPAPGSKTARLKECIGQRRTVPLDEVPNRAGVQRFVTAEYEVVDVTQGTAEAKLIRVKHYEVEVRVDGRTVNRKTVVDNARVARPQTPDADAVAVAKQVGTDSAGRPVLQPLDRAEREFVMQRYIDKNIKARRSGLLPDAAEHGVTLVMDDASAVAAGKLLPSYGVPFLSSGPGTAYLARIAKHVAPRGVTPEAMLDKLLRIVQSEGGFGQHAVVVTTDSRYLGEVAVSAW